MSDVEPYDPEDSGRKNSDDHSLVRHLTRNATEYIEFNADGGVQRTESEEMSDISDEKVPILPKKTHFFSPNARPLRKEFFGIYPKIVLILCVYLLSVFSIYWGSMFQRSKRLVNLKMIVCLEDDTNGFVSESLTAATKVDGVKQLGGWIIQSYKEPEEIKEMIHEEKYWGAVYVSSRNISSIFTQDLHTNGTFDFNSTVNAYYETGRDIMGIPNYIKPAISALSGAYEEIIQNKVYPSMLANLNNTQYLAIKNNPSLTSIPTMLQTDGNPLTNPVLLAPLQVGLIYIIILCFFQVLWFIKINIDIGSKLTTFSYIVYRMIVPQVSYLFMSLTYACLNRAFQLDLNRTWSGGFGILWMFAFLIMSACGGACENVFTVASAILPPLAGFWVLFFVCINVSATFSPIAVCPKIFRFTYAMPIRNGYELMKILFLDADRSKLGMYIGILVAWIVLNNILLPLCLIFSGYKMKKKAMQQQQGKA